MKNRKAFKITYWITTSLLALMMTFSAYAYLTQAEMKEGFIYLGFPDYFRVELAIAKLLGAAILLVPVAARIKEWAYAGFGITFISALVAHSAMADPMAARIGPIVALMLLFVSYFTYYKSATGQQKPLSIHIKEGFQGKSIAS